MKKLIVWHNLNKDTYYYKFTNGHYADYKIGYHNQYNHEIVCIVESVEFNPTIYKVSLLKMVTTPLIKLLKLIIAFLQKIE